MAALAGQGLADSTDIAVIGGGVVGAAIAYGLVRAGVSVAVIDEGDAALRASRGNFGLVWVQGKGAGFTPYAHWTRRSADLWPDFAAELRAETGVDVAHRRPGGLEICLTEDEFRDAAAELEGLQAATDEAFDYEMLDVEALRDLVPAVSGQVVGASYSRLDGHVSPLMLLRALHAGLAGGGGRYLAWGPVREVRRAGGGFEIRGAGGDRHACGRVVLAAGLGNRALAPMVGLAAPVRPVRGQILVTERVRPFLDLPTVLVRQTADGPVQIGDSHEDVGLDDGTTGGVMAAIAARAVATFPVLGDARIVRAWGALRIVTPDGAPIYDAGDHAHLATCHSGITLAAAHARLVPDWVLGAAAAPSLHDFSARRFDVPAAS